MKICYVAPVLLSTDKQGWWGKTMEDAINNAIQTTVIDPFKQALLNGWIKFISVSYAICLSIAIAGVICGGLGIKKGYKVAVISIVFYLILRMVSWANGWY